MSEITRFRGDTKAIVFQLWENKRTNSKLDIVGYAFKFTVNTNQNPINDTLDPPEFSLVGDIVGGTTDGRVKFLPSASNMDLDPSVSYYFDFQVTDAGGLIGTEMKDKLKIIQDISK